MTDPRRPVDDADEFRDGELVDLEVLAREAGVQLEVVRGFIAHGLVEPERAVHERRLFRREAVTRIARAARLRRDLGVNDAGAVLACELLARIDELEVRLARYEQRR